VCGVLYSSHRVDYSFDATRNTVKFLPCRNFDNEREVLRLHFQYFERSYIFHFCERKIEIVNFTKSGNIFDLCRKDLRCARLQEGKCLQRGYKKDRDCELYQERKHL